MPTAMTVDKYHVVLWSISSHLQKDICFQLDTSLSYILNATEVNQCLL